MSTERPTLRAVAERSGVSMKTVSRVVNGERYVAADTAARVLTVAAELGFRPNTLAREFRAGGRSATIGLVTGDVANPFYSRIARGAERALRAPGLSLLSTSNDEDADRERTLVAQLVERRVSGLLVVSADDDHSLIARERALGTPVVFLDRAPADVDADSVVLDNAGGIRTAVEHLLERGHRRIGLVGDLSRLSTHRERVHAFGDAMRAAGVPDWQRWVRSDSHDLDEASRAVRDLVDAPEPPTAIVTTNNRITTGALRALVDRTDRPALVGFDDFDLADVLGITVIASDPDAMGRVGAEELLARIAGDDGPPRHHVQPVRLVVRASSSTAR
ncbi:MULTISPECIES: LacI family DNA-binding transcriptional regulator [unclassified Curtobacterium]|uniref:LacI family DNA-binding transcriptional regulator n=1 Tax=unclassified Curtobacterium TaxID=257496 RepID=UPI001C652A99|nr:MULTISPECIES: LacI family DNA-binding transcriptional regulator [unclassified Curtobacterium]WIB15896.1 LacI family DNA-binding transcriptional regulator [Curtobacterium sp. MCPF17_050]